MTPHTRDIAVEHFPAERHHLHYLSTFFVFKDTSGHDVPITVQESGGRHGTKWEARVLVAMPVKVSSQDGPVLVKENSPQCPGNLVSLKLGSWGGSPFLARRSTEWPWIMKSRLLFCNYHLLSLSLCLSCMDGWLLWLAPSFSVVKFCMLSFRSQTFLSPPRCFRVISFMCALLS